MEIILYWNVNHFMNKKFGEKSLKREKEIIAGLVFLFVFIVIAILIGLYGKSFNLDFRNKAAGRTIYVENGQSLQEAINTATDSDAIFLKVGNYASADSKGFILKNKNIRIFGAGPDFVTVTSLNSVSILNLENSNIRIESIKISGANKDAVFITNTDPSQEVTLKEVEISSNSGNAIKSNTKLTVLNSLLSQNGGGIDASNNLIVRNTVIQNNSGDGISISGTGNLVVSNTIISKNQGSAISINGGQNHQISNVTAEGNNAGIIETVSNTKTTVSNTIVQNSKGAGISFKSTSSTAGYTNSYNNDGGNYQPQSLTSTQNNLSVDSSFVSATEYKLANNSPLLARGNPSQKNNNGTRIDLGAFGGNAQLTAANSKPIITSIPPSYAKPDQLYSYEVKATDPDNDSLTYTILNSNYPKWVKQSGNKFSGTPSASDIGFTGVVLVVSDGKGHNIVHPISINVLPTNRSLPPQPTIITTPAPSITPPVSNPVPVITFISPQPGSIFKGKDNAIRWNITGSTNIDNIQIFYSDDKQNFKVLTTLPGNLSNYSWDVSNLTPGKYLLKLKVTDKGNPPVSIEKISGEFEIQKEQTENNTITITKISPADNDNLLTRRPTIQVEFTPESELDTNQTFLKINGNPIQYSTTKSTIFYEPKSDITGNTAQIEAQLITKQGAKASRRWVFSLPQNVNPNINTTKPQVVNTINFLGLKLPKILGLILIALIVIGLLLIILYFIIKLIRTIREERQGNLEAEFTEYYDPENGVYTETAQVPGHTTATTSTTSTTTLPVNEYYAAPATNTEYGLETVKEQPVNAPTTQTSSTSYTVDTNSQVTNQIHAAPIDQSSTVSSSQNDQQTTSTQTVTTTQQVVEEDPYIKELREKYGIKESDIQNYNIEHSTTSTVEQSNPPTITSSNDTDTTPPDPSNASRPPRGS